MGTCGRVINGPLRAIAWLAPLRHREVAMLVCWLLCAAATLAGASCSSPPHREAFGDLATADRLEVVTETTTVVTDRAKIAEAAAFFERYREGWTRVLDGGAAPIYIRFKKNGEQIGGFGVGSADGCAPSLAGSVTTTTRVAC